MAFDSFDTSIYYHMHVIQVTIAILLILLIIMLYITLNPIMPYVRKISKHPYSDLSHFFSHQISTSSSIGKHIYDAVHIFCEERCFRGVA